MSAQPLTLIRRDRYTDLLDDVATISSAHHGFVIEIFTLLTGLDSEATERVFPASSSEPMRQQTIGRLADIMLAEHPDELKLVREYFATLDRLSVERSAVTTALAFDVAEGLELSPPDSGRPTRPSMSATEARLEALHRDLRALTGPAFLTLTTILELLPSRPRSKWSIADLYFMPHVAQPADDAAADASAPELAPNMRNA